MSLSASDRNGLHYWVQNKYGISLGATSDTLEPEDIFDVAEVWVADDMALSDGAAISSWAGRVIATDLAQATAAKQPVYRATSAINSQPAADFDGGDILRYTGLLTDATGGHVFAVCRFDDISSQRCLVASCDEVTDNSHNFTFSANSFGTGALEVFLPDPNRWSTSPSNSLVTATDYLVELASDGSLWSFRINGTVQAVSVIQGSNTGDWFGDVLLRDNFTVGAAKQLSAEFGFHDGLIAAVIVVGPHSQSSWGITASSSGRW